MSVFQIHAAQFGLIEMSLFDNQPELPKKRNSGKTAKTRNHIESEEQYVIPHYGAGTRSANRSTAHRRLEKSRREITMEHIRNMVPNSIPMLVNCNCSQAPYPHTAHTDEKEYFEKQRKMKHEPI